MRPDCEDNDGPLFEGRIVGCATKCPILTRRRDYLGYISMEIISNGMEAFWEVFQEQIRGNCFARTIRNEGILSQWKGNTAHMMGLMTKQHSALAALIVVTGRHLHVNLITHPMHTVVQRMMMRSGESVKYKSSSDAFFKSYKNERVQSLCKGASAQIIKSAIIGGLGMIYLIISSKNGTGRSGQPAWKNGEDGGRGSH
ncbi:hypothetical protein Dsin_021200 [Dipteronia sinensis]|uniref:ADP/ATP translocase n=1 Tax=Dipteronia sinensis TaxID=43782 RepID=A0AAE0ABH5_9ROSI|nr:hypothetical protein Dsin_021200 [Dipteronia sinensis]